METRTKTVEILNDLLEINNDRAAGFEKAAKDLKDPNLDLKVSFDQMASQSRDNVTELATEVGKNGGESDNGNSISGTLHRAWIDVKAAFGGDDRHSILEECERGEDAIKKAYRDALQENTLTEDIRQLLLKQQSGINASHDAVKALRDATA